MRRVQYGEMTMPRRGLREGKQYSEVEGEKYKEDDQKSRISAGPMQRQQPERMV